MVEYFTGEIRDLNGTEDCMCVQDKNGEHIFFSERGSFKHWGNSNTHKYKLQYCYSKSNFDKAIIENNLTNEDLKWLVKTIEFAYTERREFFNQATNEYLQENLEFYKSKVL